MQFNYKHQSTYDLLVITASWPLCTVHGLPQKTS